MARCNKELAQAMLDEMQDDDGDAGLNSRILFLTDSDFDKDFDKSSEVLGGVEVITYINKNRGWTGPEGIDKCGMAAAHINDGWYLVYEYLT